MTFDLFSDANLAAPKPTLANHTAALSPAASQQVIPISQLNRLVRQRLESGFPLCWVSGEVSNLTYAASGHVYFSLKDQEAQTRCVMFRNRAQLLGWRLENGQFIEARVLVTLYEARGDFQLNVEAARKAGLGALYEKFVQLKKQLDDEGLFAPEAKQRLPGFTRRIGIITSPQAAALRDVLSTLQRRAPHLQIVLYPTPVQGEGAATKIAKAIICANQRQDCELLILCRGGGSLEDLWAFNDENLARTIHGSALPIITGIGHETDFSIADFAADHRAATPTAAAELAAPETSALLTRLSRLQQTLLRNSARLLEDKNQQVDALSYRLQHPRERLAQQLKHLQNLSRRLDSSLLQRSAHERQALFQLSQRLWRVRPNTQNAQRTQETLMARLQAAWQNKLRHQQSRLVQLMNGLLHLNPNAVLARGYSMTSNSAGLLVRDAATLEPNEKIIVSFHAGQVSATVATVYPLGKPNNSKPS